jgi:RimJ/RimL family protein N-acetyltransferase
MAIKAPESFETERLRLRKPHLQDAQPLFDTYTQDPEVTRYLAWKPHASIDQTLEFLERCQRVWTTGESCPYVIERRKSGELLGMIELRLEGHSAGLGYVLAKAHWGKGIMTEAAQALVDWSLAQPDIFRVFAFCDTENVGSARVMEKVGMQREGRMRRYFVHPNLGGEPRDVFMYAKIKD